MARVIVVGLGPIGAGVAQAVRAEAGLELVGLVDTDPEKQGYTAAQLIDAADEAPEDIADTSHRHAGPTVVDDLGKALHAAPDVAVVATTSDFEALAPTLRTLIAQGVSVVSSCEQLAWPWYRHAALAKQIDEEAQRAGCAVLGAGVNPGFIMDVLPMTAASVLRRVTAVRCVRRVDLALRRSSLHRKLGVTLSPDECEARLLRSEAGLSGMAESVALLASGLGRCVTPGSVTQTHEMVLAERPTPSAAGLIEPGAVAGLRQLATWEGEGLSLKLDLTIAVGLSDACDRVVLEGPVRLRMELPSTVPGDSATVATLLNHIDVVRAAPAGLRTLRDVPPAGCSNRDG